MYNKKMIVSIFVAMAATLILTAMLGSCKKEKGLTLTPGILRVGTDCYYPPFEYYDEDGEMTGFSMEMIDGIAAKLGLSTRKKNVMWNSIFAGLVNKQYDVIVSSVSINEERINKYDFSDPYYNNNLVIVGRKDGPRASEPVHLDGYKIGFQIDTYSYFHFLDLANDGTLQYFKPVLYDFVVETFDDLMKNKIDFIVVDKGPGENWVMGCDKCEILWSCDDEDFFGIVLKKGNDALREAINGAMAEMHADGSWDALVHKYFGESDHI